MSEIAHQETGSDDSATRNQFSRQIREMMSIRLGQGKIGLGRDSGGPARDSLIMPARSMKQPPKRPARDRGIPGWRAEQLDIFISKFSELRPRRRECYRFCNFLHSPADSE